MEQLTLGTNRLIKPTQRRFNGAWLESQQSAIHILPQVASELTNGKYQTDFDLAFEFAQRTLVSVQNRGDDATAFKVKCDLWWLKAITDEASPYQLVELSAEQYRHAAHIREAFPRSVFHRRQNDTLEDHPDAVLVSQALELRLGGSVCGIHKSTP